MMATHTADELAVARPSNVEQIVIKAQNFEYNPLIPLKHWLRTANTLLKEVTRYVLGGRIYAHGAYLGGNLRA